MVSWRNRNRWTVIMSTYMFCTLWINKSVTFCVSSCTVKPSVWQQILLLPHRYPFCFSGGLLIEYRIFFSLPSLQKTSEPDSLFEYYNSGYHMSCFLYFVLSCIVLGRVLICYHLELFHSKYRTIVGHSSWSLRFSIPGQVEVQPSQEVCMAVERPLSLWGGPFSPPALISLERN